MPSWLLWYKLELMYIVVLGYYANLILRRIKGRINFIPCTIVPVDPTSLVENILRLLQFPQVLLLFLHACKVEGGFYTWFEQGGGGKLRKGCWVHHMAAGSRGGARSCDHCRTCSSCGGMGKGCW